MMFLKINPEKTDHIVSYKKSQMCYTKNSFIIIIKFSKALGNVELNSNIKIHKILMTGSRDMGKILKIQI